MLKLAITTTPAAIFYESQSNMQECYHVQKKIVGNRPLTYNTIDSTVVVDVNTCDCPVGFVFLDRTPPPMNHAVTMLLRILFLQLTGLL